MMEALIKKLISKNWKNVSGIVKAYFKDVNEDQSTSASAVEDTAKLFVYLSANQIIDADDLLESSVFCYDLVFANKLQNADVNRIQRSTYQIVQNLIKKCPTHALILSAKFRECLDGMLQTTARCDPEGPVRVQQMVNCYLSFWNQALEVEKVESNVDRHALALDMRAEALCYHILDPSCSLQKFINQARSAGECPNTKTKDGASRVDAFYTGVFRLLCARMRDTVMEVESPVNYAKQVVNFLLSWLQLILYLERHAKVEEIFHDARAILLNPTLVVLDCHTNQDLHLCLNIMLLATQVHPAPSPAAQMTPARSSNFPTGPSIACLLVDCTCDLSACADDSVLRQSVDCVFVLFQRQLSATISAVQTKDQIIPDVLGKFGMLSSQLIRSQMTSRLRRLDAQLSTNLTADKSNLLSLNNLYLLVHYWRFRCQSESGVQYCDDICPFEELETVVVQYLHFSSMHNVDLKSSISYFVSTMGNVISLGFKINQLKSQKLLISFAENLKKVVASCNKKEHLDLRRKIVAVLEGPSKFLSDKQLYSEALHWIAQFLAFENDFHEELFVRWMSVKRNARMNKLDQISELTVIDLVPKFAVLGKASNLLDLSKQELKRYLKYPAYYKHECCTLLTKSLMFMSNPLDKVAAWTTLAKLQLMVKEDLSSSPRQCVDEAMSLLEVAKASSVCHGRDSALLIDYYLAQTYFILCFIDFTARVDVSGVVTPPERPAQDTNPINDLVDELDTCDVNVEYIHVTMDVEYTFMEILGKALCLWTSLISEGPSSIPDIPGLLVDLKMTAEMFGVKRLVINEIRSWRLFLSVAELAKNDAEIALGTARLAGHLARLGWSTEAENYLKRWQPLNPAERKTAETKSSDNESQALVLLARSEIQLLKNAVDEGWKTLKSAFAQIEVLEYSYSSQVIKCEAMLLASKFCELPSSILRCIGEEVKSPIDWANRSFAMYSTILKWPTNQDKLISSQMRYRILGGMFDSALRLGRLYHDIGAPREARCYLKDQLLWAKHLSLANRSAELLLLLAHLDILSDNVPDCQTKLNSIDFIMSWAGEPKGANALPSTSSFSEEDSFVDASDDKREDAFQIREAVLLPRSLIAPIPVSTLVAMSPDLSKRKREEVPFWVREHKSCSNCVKCGETVFLILCLQLALVQAECNVAADSAMNRATTPNWLKRTLLQARRLLEKEEGLARQILQLVDPDDGKSVRSQASSKQPPKSVRPILETELALCHGYNRVAQLYLETGEVAKSVEAINVSSDILDALPWTGLGRIYSMRAAIKYLQCVAEICNASGTMHSLSSNLNRVFDAVWPNSQAGYSDDKEKVNWEVDCITKQVESIRVNGERLAPSSFQTPKQKIAYGSKFTGVSASEGIYWSARESADPPYANQAQAIATSCNAPIKKRAYQSAFEVEHHILSPRTPVPPKTIDNKHDEVVSGSAKPSKRVITKTAVSSKKVSVKVDLCASSSKKVANKFELCNSSQQPAPTESRKPRPTKENITLVGPPCIGRPKGAVAKKVIIYADSTDSDQFIGDSPSPLKKRALSHPRRAHVKKENTNVPLPLSPSKQANLVLPVTVVRSASSIRQPHVAVSPMVKFGLDPDIYQVSSSSEEDKSEVVAVSKRITRASARNGIAISDTSKCKKTTKTTKQLKSADRVKLRRVGIAVNKSDLSPIIEAVRIQTRESIDDQATATVESYNTFFDEANDEKFFAALKLGNLPTSSGTSFTDFRNREEEEGFLDASVNDLDTAVCSDPTFLEPGAELNLPAITVNLEEALQLINHHPCVPLYNTIHCLLALCKGEHHPDLTHHLAETMSITLRHTATQRFSVLQRKLKKDCDTEKLDQLSSRINVISFQSEFSLKRLLEKIPEAWTICQITMASVSEFERPKEKKKRSDIILTRIRHNREPVSVKISNRTLMDVVSFVNELESIFKENVSDKGESDNRKWWAKRRETDHRIEVLINNLEDTVLGHWKGFMLGRPCLPTSQCVVESAVTKIKVNLAERGFKKIDEHLLEIIVNSHEALSPLQLQRAVASLCALPLHHASLLDITNMIDGFTRPLNCEFGTRGHVILVLDKAIQGLPWESMPILRNKTVSRMPSLHFILGHLERFDSTEFRKRGCIRVNTSNVSYVLNPALDLQKSQDRMQKYFDMIGWSGITARAPTATEWSKSLTDLDFFVFCGHGAGTKYLGGDAIQNLDCRATVCLVGCSSGALRPTGRYAEPYGAVQNYIVAGCPAFLGNLWDVTDAEIDKFTEEIINQFLPRLERDSCPTLSMACTQARTVCQLKFLTGAAPILYGFPVESE